MHNNYYTLKQLTRELEPLLSRSVVSECYSQNKEELIIRFEIKNQSFYIKANLQPSFSCLSFPEVFHRARKNSVDLFPDCIGLTVESIRQFNDERSFAIALSHNFSLLFKMHGNRSNVVLFEGDQVHTIFRNNLEADENIAMADLDKNIDWRIEAMPDFAEGIRKHFFTLGKLVWRLLEKESFFTQAREMQWKRLLEIKLQLESPAFYITESEGSILLSLLPTGNIILQEGKVILALTQFYNHYQQFNAFEQEKAKALQAIGATLKSTNAYLSKTRAKLNEVTHDQHYKIWADVLMANMHAIKPGATQVSLPDFYNNNQLIEIKLKQELSPQKNAEVFYRKSKNQQQEIERLQKALDEKETEKQKSEALQTQLSNITSLKELRALLQTTHPSTNKKEKVITLPFHEFVYKDYIIWVGKNAQANDLLTLKHSRKEDLWLHAKDVAGSHVIIKQKSGKAFPKDVIERAAQLAAYNSKRKSEGLVPVAYTPKKFVRKRKGDPAGLVVVEREEVILVEPRLIDS
ncbi:DUF814 domain-containing protein [Chryseotalea sanaruensis]|uniref:DUF814 domain-containing protein n=1 Tax=Chryseotalea sanaruensis TaxID=2482724 RepID=A0A401UA71_9BACT|nr:NFACT RNA binding domain-containing protein [Chryseotalea sanaruensis]GCC51806.1 DUF814 domain-containing protein [Chryseotalea sanaruensis]